MRGPRWYILDGKEPKPASFSEGARFLEDADARRVAITDIDKHCSVSTVFLGLDHQYGEGPPLLFETMVFGGKLDGHTDRYCTYDEAEAGHAAVVALARQAQLKVIRGGKR